MFDRFTDRARKVMGLSRQAAQSWSHDYIGTEHVLLGLLKEASGVASLALKNLGVDSEKIETELKKHISVGVLSVTKGQLPFTPRCKKALEFALEEASTLGHTYIGTEHLLLGMIREGAGSALMALTACGVNAETVRKEVLSVLGSNTTDADGKEKIAVTQVIHAVHVVSNWSEASRAKEARDALEFVASLPPDGTKCDHAMRHQPTETVCSGWYSDVMHAIELARAALKPE